MTDRLSEQLKLNERRREFTNEPEPLCFRMDVEDQKGDQVRSDHIYYASTPGRSFFDRTLQWAIRSGHKIRIIPEKKKGA